jgi:hypothetical protein
VPIGNLRGRRRDRSAAVPDSEDPTTTWIVPGWDVEANYQLSGAALRRSKASG